MAEDLTMRTTPTRFLMKRCPRCQGDLIAERTLDGYEATCIQCGRTVAGRELDDLLIRARGERIRRREAYPAAR